MSTEVITNFIHGKAIAPQVENFGDVHNPSTGEVIAKTPFSQAHDVDAAVESAGKAFPSWSDTPAPTRAKILFECRRRVAENLEALSQLICEENGKTFGEAKGDVTRGLEVLEFACNIPHLLMGESLPQMAEHIDGTTSREPLGVCAGITPFNFPVMVPMWMFPLAIACGNTFILKPSEKVPRCANRLAQIFLEAGLPEGVFNVVHGGREAVETICAHPGISAVSFVGSTSVARAVYEQGTRAGKRVQAAGGAKNVMVVMPDAERDSTLRAIMGAAFGCAGQRCMAGSILMGIGDIADPLKEGLVSEMDALTLGDTSRDRSVGMGAMIDSQSRDRLFGVIEKAAQDKVQIVRDGRSKVPNQGFYLGPTLFDHVSTDQVLFNTELFGPALCLSRPSSLDDAIQQINRLPYGNGASIFTSSGAAAREFSRKIQCGMIGVNVGVPAPMAIFPFSGWGRSFFGDLHVQGMEGVSFYTRKKVVLSRWDDTYVRKQGW